MSPKEFMERICDTSASDGVMDLARVRGYSDGEISQIESATALRLPEYYKEFLRVLGKCGGGFMRGTHMFPKDLNDIVNWRPLASRLMATGKAEETLPSNAYVFGDHQGYQFWYFIVDPQNDDPPVFYYHENDKRPRKLHNHFTEFVLKMVDEDRRLKEWLARMRQERDEARAAWRAWRRSGTDDIS